MDSKSWNSYMKKSQQCLVPSVSTLTLLPVTVKKHLRIAVVFAFYTAHYKRLFVLKINTNRTRLFSCKLQKNLPAKAFISSSCVSFLTQLELLCAHLREPGDNQQNPHGWLLHRHRNTELPISCWVSWKNKPRWNVISVFAVHYIIHG